MDTGTHMQCLHPPTLHYDLKPFFLVGWEGLPIRLTRLEQSNGIAGVPCNVCDMPEDLSYIGVIVPRARNIFIPQYCRTLVYSSFSAQLHRLHLMDNVWYCLNGMQGGKKLWKPLTFHLRLQRQLHSCLSEHLPRQKQLKIHMLYLSTQRKLCDSWISK